MEDTFKMEAEYTDTFGGEANYSWVRRVAFEVPHGASNRAIMRKAKKLIGLNGLRGRTEDFGDSLTFKPYGMATVMFVNSVY